MTQALLPALLQSSGTVVNISSVGGRVAMATYGAYAGSKFAMEAVSDALRREVAEFGVTVIVVEPGAVTTEMSGRGVATADRLAAGMTSDQHQRYDALIDAITTQSRTFARERRSGGARRSGDRRRDHHHEPAHPLHHRTRRRHSRATRPLGPRPIPRPDPAPQPEAALLSGVIMSQTTPASVATETSGRLRRKDSDRDGRAAQHRPRDRDRSRR